MHDTRSRGAPSIENQKNRAVIKEKESTKDIPLVFGYVQDHASLQASYIR